MTEVVKFPIQAEVEDEAAAWLWRIDDENATAADRKAFQVWLRRDLRHRRAYEEFERLWRQLDDLGEAKRHEKIATFTDPRESKVSRRWVHWTTGVAAIFLVLVAIHFLAPRDPTSEAFATAVGQQRTVTLADESVVTLNTNTIVETRLTSNLRDVYLRKGEAHFVVAHDRSRPFLVHAGRSVVRAVGTEFDVRVLDANQVDVVVNEGRVEVQGADAPAPFADPTPTPAPSVTRVLEKGERLRTGVPDVSVQTISIEDLSRSMAWRHGEVVFDGQPLAQAIAELSRYTDTRFIVTDPRIINLPVGGRFRTNDVQDFLAALGKAVPIVVRRTADGEVYIEPRS